jgi:hypothetical protein
MALAGLQLSISLHHSMTIRFGAGAANECTPSLDKSGL